MKAFAKKLLQMEQEEQTLRQDIINRGELMAGYHPELRAVHEQQVAWVQNTVKEKGWPTLKTIGDDGYDALFMVALNGISQPEFMRYACQQFQKSKDTASKIYYAHLVDRIAYFERKPQVYGTQWDINAIGETVLWPVEEPLTMDSRRKGMGLEPFEELDFALVELDLGQGLKRLIGQYDFIYQSKWITPDNPQALRVLEALTTYESGAIMGFSYSLSHYMGTLSERRDNIDLLMPLQHKEAFDQFIQEEEHTVVTKGLKHGTYALKDDLGFVHITVTFVPFEEGEEDWVVGGINMPLGLATAHTANGWLLTAKALLAARKMGLMTLNQQQEGVLSALIVD